jgi:hypothetical protein
MGLAVLLSPGTRPERAAARFKQRFAKGAVDFASGFDSLQTCAPL